MKRASRIVDGGHGSDSLGFWKVTFETLNYFVCSYIRLITRIFWPHPGLKGDRCAGACRPLHKWPYVKLYFPVLFCLSVSVKWLAVKTASEMTYTVSSGALNSTPNNQVKSATVDSRSTALNRSAGSVMLTAYEHRLLKLAQQRRLLTTCEVLITFIRK